jgi:hypothetical protein
MDSPSVDSTFGSIGAPNPILLEEDQIILSQPCLFLQDMMSEANKNSVSVIIDEEKSTNAPNRKKVARLPKKTVQKAPLIAEQEKKTKKAEAHVAGLKILNDYKRRVEVEEAALVELKKSTKITIDNSLKRAEKAEVAFEELEKKIGSTIENYQRRAQNAEKPSEELKNVNKQAKVATASALDDFKRAIGAILNAGDDELKKQCCVEKVRIFGGAAMKHKYACALLKSCIED